MRTVNLDSPGVIRYDIVIPIYRGIGIRTDLWGLKSEDERRMDLKRIFTEVAIAMVLVVGLVLLSGLSDRWEDRLHQSQDPEAESLFNDVRALSLSLHGEDSLLFNRDVGRVERTISLNCFRFKDSSKCEPAKTRLRSVIDRWNQRLGIEPATTR